MAWDHELEKKAQDYLNTCPGMNHNPDKASPHYQSCGENIYMMFGG